MKAYDIISSGFALAGESFEDYPDRQIALSWLNVCMAESTDSENLIREKTGKEILTEPLKISELYENVDMDERICSVCLPYGVAVLLFFDRERNSVAEEMRIRFYASLKSRAKAVELPVTDCYRGGEYGG